MEAAMMTHCFVDHETCAIADISPFRDGFMLNRINVPERHRGNGYGSRLLKRVLAEADTVGAKLYLEPLPSGPLGLLALVDWYERHGFVRHADVNGHWLYMVRAPAPKTA